jgi:hypothetical protein
VLDHVSLKAYLQHLELWPGLHGPDYYEIVALSAELFAWDAAWLCCEANPGYFWGFNDLDLGDPDQMESRRLGQWFATLSGTVIGYDAGE